MRNLLFALLAFLVISCQNPSARQASSQINGVWIAAPEHNTLMHSHKNIQNGIKKLNQIGINTLFVCTWANNKTAYPSKVLLENSTYSNIEETSLFYDFDYRSPSNDPIQDLIDEAHKYDMKVIFWFEYGFMASWGKSPLEFDHPIAKKHPDWIGLNNKKAPCNYNGSDFYFNAYNPEVQSFLLNLVSEALNKYPEVDGAQGDDRMPANPINSGYDAYTTEKYKSEHQGENPPHDFENPDWLRWRLNILNNFALDFYNLVKSKNPSYLVAFSPNPYPWCKENLMQDWPTWVQDSIVEILCVQCYRKEYESYKATFDEMMSYIPKDLNIKVAPGIILGTGSGKMVEKHHLDSILNYNKSKTTDGQSFFYVKWLLESQEYIPTITKYTK